MASVIPVSGGPEVTARSWPPRWLAVTCLVVGVVLAYWNSLGAPFLFDDTGAVLQNPTIRRLASLATLNPPTDGSTTTNRPIVNLSYAINYAISGESVWSYHALNVAIHVLAALTLMGIVRRTLSSSVLRGNFGAAAPWLAFLTALLWALHPLQTESVVCIAQRTESLCGLFYLLTLYSFIRGTGAGAPGWPWLAASVVSCLAGMGTKEVTVTAPLVVLVFDRTFVAGDFSAAWRRCRVYYAALASTWLLLAWIMLGAGGSRGFGAGFGLGVSWWTYLLKQSEAIVVYLKLSFWPHPLVLDYGTAVVRSVADVWWQGPVVIGLVAGTLWALVRKPVLGFAGAWFFVILAPSSSVMPIVTQTMAEHRMYLPLAAVIASCVLGLHALLKRLQDYATAGPRDSGTTGPHTTDSRTTGPQDHGQPDHKTTEIREQSRLRDRRPVVPRSSGPPSDVQWSVVPWSSGRLPVVLFLALACPLGWLTVSRIRDYLDVVAIWTDNVAKNPQGARGHNNLAWALQQQGKTDQANAHFARAVALQPGYVAARYNWGVALLDQGRIAEAIAQLETAVRLAPNHADAYVNLGNALMQVQRAAEAIPHYEMALRLRPGADVHYDLGVALMDVGRDEEAAAHFQSALDFNRALPEAHYRLARLAERAGRLVDAERGYNQVLQLAPGHAGAHARLGLLLARSGQLPVAVEHLRTAVRLAPADADAHAFLGVALLLQDQPREAIASFEESLRLRPDDARTRENLQLAREALH